MDLLPFELDHSVWRPPKDLTLSQWAAEKFYLTGSSAGRGKFRPFPYQPGIMDALTDPHIEEVTWKKSARVGATLIMDVLIGYHMEQDPCPILVMQPTADDARGYSTEEIDVMLRDVPALSRIRLTRNTQEEKVFPGGVLQIASSRSPGDFRRVSRRVIIGDERDGCARSSGKEGSPWDLAKKRSEFYWNRKFYSVSTPTFEGDSPIDDDFLAGDQRYFHVPCPLCGTFDKLVFSHDDKGGHFMEWPSGKPEQAHFVCFHCAREIEHSKKRDMVDPGEWVITAPSERTTRIHASFHIWAGYSYSPNSEWGQLASEFVEANRKGPESLKVYVNTNLGECWKEQGDAPDWDRLFNRREQYPVGTVPQHGQIVTCGVDVQQDSIRYEVVAWGAGFENWSVECGILWGGTATADDEAFRQLDSLLVKTFRTEQGTELPITKMAIDSGNFTQTVYSWCKRYQKSRVYPVKGSTNIQAPLVVSPTKQEVRPNGRKMGSIMLWVVGVGNAKTELYGWLRQKRRDDGTFPTGYCHFPEHGERYFQELTSEYLVTELDRNRRKVRRWKVHPGRENHFLDCRNYARHAAALCKVDRIPARPEQLHHEIPEAGDAGHAIEVQPPQAPARQPVQPRKQLTKPNSFLRGGGAKRRKGWL